jgi:hypothetical protein
MLSLSATRYKIHKYAFNGMTCDSVVGVAIRLGTSLFGFRTVAGVSNFASPETSRPALGHSRPLFSGQWIPWFFPRGKAAGA